MNIELYIGNKIVELDDSFDIRLNKELYNTEELTSKELTYSFTIQIPTTQHNKEIFNYVDTEEVPNKFNQVYDAELYCNSTLIMRGKYVNQEIDVDYYSGNLYTPSQKTLSDIFGDLAMSKIKKRMMYINTWDDMGKINTKARFNSNADDRYLVYPYVLYNLPYNSASATSDKYIQYASNKDGGNWNYDVMIPAFQIVGVIRDIFETFNLKVDGNIFTDPRFTELYMSVSKEIEEFYANKITPYYAKITGQYDTVRNNNIDKTLAQVNQKDGFRTFSSNLLLSENTHVSSKTDEYEMLSKADNNNTIHIKKSGWYRVHSAGDFGYYNAKNQRWTQNGRYNSCSVFSDGDRSSLDSFPFELQIVRSQTGVSQPKMLGVFGFQPSDNHTDSGRDMSYRVDNSGVYVNYDKVNTKFPINGGTMKIYDSTDPNSDNFIHGAHFGIFGYDKGSGGRNDDRWNCLGSFLYNNPNPTKNNNNEQKDSDWYRYAKNYWDRLYYFNQVNPMIRTFGKNVRSFGCFDENYLYTSQQVDDDWVKKFTKQNDREWYNGLNISGASLYSNLRGMWDVSSVIWLEEGDMIDIVSITPLHAYQRESCSFWRCKMKDKSDCAPNINIKFELEIGLINSNKDWNYKDEDIPYFELLKKNRESNVNALLPDEVTINEFLNNFISTFNLSLTKENSNTYTINSNTNNDTIGKIIDIEPYTDISKNKYTRIDSPSEYQFNFNFDTEEEGYTQQGKNNLKPKEYTGQGVFTNPAATNGTIDKKDTIFSYCWYKNIDWVDQNNNKTTLTVPVISDSEIWSDGISYIEAQDKNLFLNNNLRMFYVDFSQPYKYNILANPNNSGTSMFIYPVRNNVSGDGTLELTFDKKINNSITNKLFNIKMSSGHEVETSLYLPPHLFNNIDSSTRFKMNNDIYQVKALEGFDPTEQEETTLTLIKE